jgi:hypothetical protein
VLQVTDISLVEPAGCVPFVQLYVCVPTAVVLYDTVSPSQTFKTASNAGAGVFTTLIVNVDVTSHPDSDVSFTEIV